MIVRMAEAVALGQSGEHERARQALSELWTEITPTGNALHRCALSHHMADLQDDVAEELRWDLLALEAADSVSEQQARAAGVLSSVRSFYPSLHLNIAEAYRKLGNV